MTSFHIIQLFKHINLLINSFIYDLSEEKKFITKYPPKHSGEAGYLTGYQSLYQRIQAFPKKAGNWESRGNLYFE